MSAEPEDIKEVEARYPEHKSKLVEAECPSCGLSVGHLGDCLIGGIQAREILYLKMQLASKDETITRLEDKIINPDMVWVHRKDLEVYLHRNAHYVEEIKAAFNNLLTSLTGNNPADDPNNCLACMGATGSAVRHTCKQE